MADKAEGPGKRPSITDQEALQFHSRGRPGKLEIVPTKPMATQRDLSLAYSPGVAVPVKAIAADPSTAYDYTSRGNMVAVISNGTAILGLGNLGALASKPVMEGKAVLFKRFADVDSIDLEVDTEDPDEFINAVRYLGPSFGGINLEDIKAPECFIIEERLRETDGYPGLPRRSARHRDHRGGRHDQRHPSDRPGYQVDAARLQWRGRRGHRLPRPHQGDRLRAEKRHPLRYQGRRLSRPCRGHEPVEVGPCGRHAAAHAGGRDGGRRHLLRPLRQGRADARDGEVHGARTRSSSPWPIPIPRSRRRTRRRLRDDVIIATGRSDYPNQVNNVLGFPYIFRGALDVRAKTINMEMKVAATHALAELAREDVPDEVAVAYRGARPRFGRDYIIPVPFDPRLIHVMPIAVAKAAMESGVARRPIVDLDAYKAQLSARRDPIAGAMQRIIERVRRMPKRVVFAEGEEEQVIRAAQSFVNQGLGTAILVGREERVRAAAQTLGLDLSDKGIEIHNARLSHRNAVYAQFLYERLQRKGYLLRDCQRLINQDRNHFAAAMVAQGDADAMVTGVTRNFSIALEEVRRVIDDKPGHRVVGVSIILARGRPIVAADTAITEMPTAEDLAEIAIEAAGVARRLGYEPRVAMLAFSNFGHPPGERTQRVQEAVRLLDERRVDFEYDGEMGADVALNKELMAAYPFCRLSDTANVLVMPALHSAAISTRVVAGAWRSDGHRTDDRRAGKAGSDRIARRKGLGHRQYGGDGEL